MMTSMKKTLISVTRVIKCPARRPKKGEGVADGRGEQEDNLEVEQANCLIKVFHAETSRILNEGLLGDMSPEKVANDYV